MKYTITTVVCGAYQENAYLICPENTRDCYLVDPGDDLAALQNAVARSGRMLRGMLLTHGHFDHMLAAQPLNRITGAPIHVHERDMEMLCDAGKCSYSAEVSTLPCPDIREAEVYGDAIEIGGISFEILHTPGHTPGSVCLYDKENGVLFSGDTLFCAGFGRTDLHGGNMRQMLDSLKCLFALPNDTRVLPGHGADTTILQEKRRYGQV